MTAPRLEIHLDRIGHNARTLLDRLAPSGIGVTAVTKATLGSPEIARQLLASGITSLGDSRIENVEALRRAGITAPITLIRSPMLSQVDRVVAAASVSLNSETAVIEALSAAAGAQRRQHGIVLMVELGDRREGILPADVLEVARAALRLPNLVLRGIGTNLACHSGVAPDDQNMGELSALANSLEAQLDHALDIVSGGNSANLSWALGNHHTGRVNDLRLGEAILLGREPLERQPIEGLRGDCFTLVAEVIESNRKPTRPQGTRHQNAFGTTDDGAVHESGDRPRAILAVGRQDVDPDGLEAPAGLAIMGSSSDHLIVRTPTTLPIGSEVSFRIDGYSSLLRAMTSPFLERCFSVGRDPIDR